MNSNESPFNFFCAFLPPALLLFCGSVTVILAVAGSAATAYVVLASLIVFITIIVTGVITMIWSVFQSRKRLFLSSATAVILSIIPMVLLSGFLFVFTLMTYRPAEAAEKNSVLERVWRKTPIYPHLDGVRIGLNTLHAWRTGDEQRMREANEDLEKLLVYHLNLKQPAEYKKVHLRKTFVDAPETLEMLRITQALAVHKNFHDFVACSNRVCEITLLQLQEFVHITPKPTALIQQMKEKGYITDLSINEAGDADGSIFILTDKARDLALPTDIEIDDLTDAQQRAVYYLFLEAKKRYSYRYRPAVDFLDYDHVKGDGFKAIFLRNNDRLIVFFWGSDFLNPDDPVTNFKLGRDPQWEQHREEVLSRVKTFIEEYPERTVHFAGYSLGGALAQYAVYETAALGIADWNTLHAYTFNSIGVQDEIGNLTGSQQYPLGQYDPTHLRHVQMWHFMAMGDVVSLLGGGHLKGDRTEKVLLGNLDDDAFFLRAHYVDGLLRYVDQENQNFTKSYEFPGQWYLKTATIQSQTGRVLGYLLQNGRGQDEEVWFRILMSVSWTLGSSALDGESRSELERLRSWVLHNTVMAGRMDLCKGFSEVNWMQLRERAKHTLDEQRADRLTVRLYVDVLNGSDAKVKEFQRLHGELSRMAHDVQKKPWLAAQKLADTASDYMRLVVEAGVGPKGEDK